MNKCRGHATNEHARAPPRLASRRPARRCAELGRGGLSPAAARHGRFGCAALPAGFGHPPSGDVVQIQVEDGDWLRVTATTSTASRSTASTRRCGPPRGVVRVAAGGAEELRADADAALARRRPQLWPEHFDVAIELGDEAAGKRATYGAVARRRGAPSPTVRGDLGSAPDGPLWNATASGRRAALRRPDRRADRRADAHDIYRSRQQALGV